MGTMPGTTAFATAAVCRPYPAGIWE